MGAAADRRADRRAARRDARLERKLALQGGRQAGRSARSTERQETKQSAYKSGVNPNQFVSDLTGLAGQGLQTFAALKTGGSLPEKSTNSSGMPSWAVPVGLAAVGLLAFLMMKK